MPVKNPATSIIPSNPALSFSFIVSSFLKTEHFRIGNNQKEGRHGSSPKGNIESVGNRFHHVIAAIPLRGQLQNKTKTDRDQNRHYGNRGHFHRIHRYHRYHGNGKAKHKTGYNRGNGMQDHFPELFNSYLHFFPGDFIFSVSPDLSKGPWQHDNLQLNLFSKIVKKRYIFNITDNYKKVNKRT
jgi:hypothetical protein